LTLKVDTTGLHKTNEINVLIVEKVETVPYAPAKVVQKGEGNRIFSGVIVVLFILIALGILAWKKKIYFKRK